MRALLLALVLACVGLAALAQPVPATDVPRVAFPLSPVGNVTTVGAVTADAANAKRFSFGVAANGAVFANTGSTMPTPGGASIPIGVNGQVSKPNVGAALGRFMRKTLPVLSVGSALYDLGQELGLTLSTNNGVLVGTRPQAELEGYFDAYEYSYPLGVWYHDWRTPCNARVADLDASDTQSTYSVPHSFSVNGATGYCNTYRTQLSNGAVFPNSVTISVRNQTSTPPPLGTEPVTVQDVEDAIAARSSWPTSSALARTLVDAINSGESVLVEPLTVTGPASSPGAVTQSVNASAGTTTTSTQTHNYTYNGPNVTVSTVTNNVTTNNSTGAVIDSSTTTITPETPTPSEPPVAVCGGPGLPACNVKVDEAGTPQYDPDPFTLPESLQQQTEQQLEQIADTADKAGLFSDFASLFTLPPLRECAPVALPALLGRELGSLNPCAGVDWLRGLMAWVWAVAGFLFCWGCVRESI